MTKCWSFLLLLVCMVTANANEDSIFPQYVQKSRLIYHVAPKQDTFRVMLGSIKKIDGRWRGEKSELISGVVEAKTYELERGATYRNVKKYIEGQLENNLSTVVFQCEGFDCGSSHAWANEIFGMKYLYGLDSSQYYAVIKDGAHYVIYYLVLRGNHRIYLHEHRILTSGALLSSGDAIIGIRNALQTQGYWVIPTEGSKAEEKNWGDALVRLLNRHPNAIFALVEHSDSIQLSEAGVQSASQIATYLEGLGLTRGAVRVIGVGSLAPRKNQPKSRVELVLQKGELNQER